MTSSRNPKPIPKRRPLVKICGITRVEDAAAAIELGADLIGLNFWPQSPRFVTNDKAREIAAAVGGRACRVGVFVNESVEGIRTRTEAASLDIVQLHGDEAPGLANQLPIPAWRAFRGIPSMESFRLWHGVAGYLIDARKRGEYGGTGEEWKYDGIRSLARDSLPLLVAGGITPENAREALQASGADGVDVASGVESSPGVKDREKMRRLIEEVRRVER